MHFRLNRKALAVATAGLCIFAGGLAICQATPACSRKGATNVVKPASNPVSGEKDVFVKQEIAQPEKRQVQHANEANFASLVLNSTGPVLVDFYADWCGPCKRLVPVLDELAVAVPDVMIVKVNVDHSPNLAAEYGVDSIPKVMVFKNGEVTGQRVGLASKRELQALLGL